MKPYLIILSIAAVLLTACEQSNGVTKPVELRLSPQQQEMLQVSNDFSFNLLREVVAEDSMSDNIVLSPLSASIVLGMVMNGADGETLKQMKQALGFKDYPIEDINEYYNLLIDALPALDKTNKLKIANAIWAQENFPFEDSFKKVNKEYFYAKVDNADFNNSRTADIINRWAAHNTNNLIKEVVSPEDLRSVVMLLANALYFKGIWKEKFEKSNTKPQDFTTANGETIKVDMMNQREEFQYADIEGGQLLRMYYKEYKYCMDILLPEKGVSLKKMIADLNAEQWNEWMREMDTYNVKVSFPRLEARYEKILNEPLQKSGIVDAFNPLTANFSKMSTEALYISLAKQLCYMKVDEEGTEAAAVTVIGVKNAAEPFIDRNREFIADRPYLMVIREKQYGTILFTAMIGKP